MAADAPRFRKRIADLTIAAGQTSVVRAIGIGGTKYCKVESFRAKAVTDTATQIELKDAKGRVFYKDAADKDYATAAVNRVFFSDSTVTGLGFSYTDATGAAIDATAPTQVARPGSPIVEGPITVTWSNGTAADTLHLELMLEV